MTKRKDAFELSLISKYRSQLFAIAILLVVFHHFAFKYEHGVIGKAYMFLRVTGAIGTDMFLFLSGMGCYFSFSENESIPGFLARRFKRILPAYFLISIPVYFVVDVIMENTGILTYLADVFLVSFWINGGGGDWYITATVFLYLLFPIIYRFTTRVKHGSLLLLIMWSVVVITIYSINRSYLRATSRLWARIPVFILGVAIAPKIKRGTIVDDGIRKLIVIIIIGMLFLLLEAYFALLGSEYAYSFMARLFYCPLAISLIIVFTILLNKIKMRRLKEFLGFIGSITLEIYLLNQRLITACSSICEKLTGNNNLALFIGNIAGVIVTVLISWLLHEAIKKIQKKIVF